MLTEYWPAVFQSIADEVGASGAALMVSDGAEVSIVASSGATRLVDDYLEGGWHLRNEAAAPLLGEMYPGFRVKTDFWTPEQLAVMPVQVEFFEPRGLIGGAATVFQGAADCVMHFTVDGFPTHAAAERARAFLDDLRPHLGRAFSLSALMGRQQAQAMVDGLAMGGVPAAIVDSGLGVRAANDLFVSRLGDQLSGQRDSVRFSNAKIQDQFLAAVQAQSSAGRGARSLPIRHDNSPPFVVHLLPLLRRARDWCGHDGTLVIVAEAQNRNVPDADLLRLLFDLTPAQAKLTRLLLEGLTLAEAAAASRVSVQTGKVHLRAIYAKIGVSRQADLIRLLTSLGAPASMAAPTG